MAKPPQKKSKSNQTQDDSGLDTYFDEFFRNNEPHQLDETPEPEQQRQWISDQLMWETTLGMREDETINRVITPEDDIQATNTSQQTTPRRPLSEQERQLLRTQVIEPANTVKPGVDTKPPQQTTRVQAQKPQPTRAQPSGQQPTASPQTTARQGSPRQGTTVPRGKSVTTVSKAPVKHVAQQQSQPSSKAAAKPVANTAQQPKPAVKIREPDKPRTQNVVPPRADTRTPSRTTPQAKPAAPKPNPHTQTQPVREADLSLESHIDFDIDEKVLREKYYKIGKKVAAALGIAIVSFICGYYVGGSNTSPTPVSQTDIDAALAKMEQSITKKTQQPAPKKSAPKKAKPKPAPVKQTSEPASLETSPEPTSDVPPGAAAVFEGKEIDIEQFEQPILSNETSQKPTDLAGDPSNEFDDAVASAIASETGTANFLTTPANDEASGVAGEPGTSTAPMAAATETAQAAEDDMQNLLDQSLQAFENEQWELLVELSNQILVKDPGVVTALTNRAAANTELGSYVQALADCNLAIKLDPNNPLAINNRGYVYEKMGDPKNAIADYQKACELGIEVSCNEAQRLQATITE